MLTKKYCLTSSLHNKKQPRSVRSLSIHQPPHLLLAWTLTKMIHSHVWHLFLVKCWDYTERQYFKTGSRKPREVGNNFPGWKQTRRYIILQLYEKEGSSQVKQLDSHWSHSELCRSFFCYGAHISDLLRVLFQRTKQGRSICHILSFSLSSK